MRKLWQLKLRKTKFVEKQKLLMIMSLDKEKRLWGIDKDHRFSLRNDKPNGQLVLPEA